MTTFPDTSGMTTEQLSQAICEWFDDPLNKTSYAAVQRTVEKLTNYHAPHGFMLEDFNLLCGMVSDELHKDRAEVRRDALLEALGWACAEMCHWCGIGIEVKQLEEEIMLYKRLYGPKGSWVHFDGETGKFLECHATPIRKLMIAADQGQGKGKE